MTQEIVPHSFDKQQQRQVLIITGLSGAGKNALMRTLEDLGFYCVDNLPVPLMSTFLQFAVTPQTNLLKVALGIDARGGDVTENFVQEATRLKAELGDGCRIVFVRSSEQVLLKRFQETRRSHPLARGISVQAAIRKEKKLLEPIRRLADITLDTDNLNIHELRRWVSESFDKELSRAITVNLVSFGFKYGVPAESNLVCDIRFLPNPYFIPALKALDGKAGEIDAFLFSQPAVQEYWELLSTYLSKTIAKYFEEGRFFANVAIGCTGGRHRSVAFVERLSRQDWGNTRFLVHHRDVSRADEKK